MKRSLKISIFIIFTVLLNSGIVYSQTRFWEPTNNFPPHSFFSTFSSYNSITITDNEDIWVIVDYGIFLSTDNGDTWIIKNDGLVEDSIKIPTYVLGINPVTSSVFAGTWSTLYKSTDSGKSWTNLKDNSSYLNHVTKILITPSGEIYVVGYSEKTTAEEGVLYSSDISYSNDDGNTWIRKNNGLPLDILILSVALGTDGTLYAATSSGVYHSTNGGDNWLPSSNYNNQRFNDLSVAGDGLVFATTQGGGVLKSTDNGITWDQAGYMYGSFKKVGTTYAPLDKIVYNPITNSLLVSGSGVGDNAFGLYRSDDLGKTWHEIWYDLPQVGLLRDFVVNPTTGIVFVGLLVPINSGKEIVTVYRSVGGAMPVEEIEDIPTTYSLSQNYPNPFNPTTTIQYSIPKDEFVKLVVYDVTGKAVKELVSGHKTAGRYSVEFNASSYSSGTYYYKIEAGEYKSIQKMMLVK